MKIRCVWICDYDYLIIWQYANGVMCVEITIYVCTIDNLCMKLYDFMCYRKVNVYIGIRQYVYVDGTIYVWR